MHPSSPRCTIAFRVADAQAREQITAALAQAHFTVLAMPSAVAAPNALLRDAALLIDDLSPCDEAALERLLAHRTERPKLPILLYYPDNAIVTALATRAALLPGVAIRRQTPLLSGEAIQIAGMVHTLLAAIPGLAVRFVVRHILPDARRVLGLVNTAVARMELAAEHPPEVAELSAKMSVSGDALRHACHRTGIPAPKQLLEWIILLYVSATADHYTESFDRAAKRSGLSGEYVRRLRARLLPEVTTLREATPQQLFTLAVCGLARACGLPGARAEKMLEKLAAVGPSGSES